MKQLFSELMLFVFVALKEVSLLLFTNPYFMSLFLKCPRSMERIKGDIHYFSTHLLDF